MNMRKLKNKLFLSLKRRKVTLSFASHFRRLSRHRNPLPASLTASEPPSGTTLRPSPPHEEEKTQTTKRSIPKKDETTGKSTVSSSIQATICSDSGKEQLVSAHTQASSSAPHNAFVAATADDTAVLLILDLEMPKSTEVSDSLFLSTTTATTVKVDSPKFGDCGRRDLVGNCENLYGGRPNNKCSSSY